MTTIQGSYSHRQHSDQSYLRVTDRKQNLDVYLSQYTGWDDKIRT